MGTLSDSIAKRYDGLSKADCCLSCGGAFPLAEIRSGDVCVDLGCGKGLDLLRMATLAGPKGFAYGVDISTGMMETAWQNAKKLNLENVDFVRSELENIQLEDDLANVVISNCTINHSLDQAKVWQEGGRILKKGGHFVVSDIYSIKPVPAQYRSNPDMVAECWAGAEVKEKYLQNLIDAGFEKIEILEESRPYQKGKIEVASFTIKGIKK